MLAWCSSMLVIYQMKNAMPSMIHSAIIIICYFFSRLPWVTVRHEYIGRKAYQIPHSTAVRDIKQLIYEETDLPVIEQQLVHNGKVVGKRQFYKL